MEEVELFLAPLTARSKVREVLRGLVATRQVHTMSVGHAPHYYVAGTLPEFTPPPTLYTSAAMQASSYFLHSFERDEEEAKPAAHHSEAKAEAPAAQAADAHLRRPAARKSAPAPKAAAARPHFSRPAVHSRDRKPAQSSPGGRVARHAKNNHANHNGASRSSRPAGPAAARGLKSASAGTRTKHTVAKTASQPAHGGRTRPVAAGTKTAGGKRFGYTSASGRGSKKRG